MNESLSANKSHPLNEKKIILFDGLCNLCSASVKFILKRDKKGQFYFTSLQSDAGRALLLQFEQKKYSEDSVILIKENRLFEKSSAAMEICKDLDQPYPLLGAFGIVPKSLRDRLYEWVARNRFHWFGKRNSCLLSVEGYRERFL